MSTNDTPDSPSTPAADKPTPPGTETASNFIRELVQRDNATGKYAGKVATRFPPEPNGYLHIGHAKSICLNFGLAQEFGGTCNLRMDDTNPTKEDVEYVEAIKEDVEWLGFHWSGFFHAADYFERLYQFAEELVRRGKAYVCSLTEEEMRVMRGTVTEPGKPSPDRDKSPEHHLDLLRRMRAGEFEDGKYTLRAKADMASPNMKMRDLPLYRIRRAHHHRTGDAWCIYPLYDFAHCLSDSIEGITHSICTLEFENNREVYDWILEALDAPRPRPEQTEFARLNLSYTMMSKRKLLQLVQEKHVHGWDDPRMPTISGFRRKGYTPGAIRAFCERIGVARRESMVDLALLEYSIRDDLNTSVGRAMGVLRPLELVIDNYPEGQVDEFESPNYPDEPAKMGSRKVPFGKTLYIEREDFMEDPPKKFFRLAPGNEVRLRFAYLVRCTSVDKDEAGNVVRVHCTYDPESRGGNAPDGRKVKGTIHWVSAAHAVDAEVRVYENLFTVEDPATAAATADLASLLNPKSLEVLQAKLERSLGDAPAGTRVQFERQGFFFKDPVDAAAGKVAWNRIVSLKDGWAKVVAKG